jgi:hypothetical protein
MIAQHRREFFARYTDQKYARFLQEMETRCETPIPFRMCETPCFFSSAVLEGLIRTTSELYGQISRNTDYIAMARGTLPKNLVNSGYSDDALFIQADFGIDENLEPKLVEIQGFPSLYCFQSVLSETYRDVYDLDSSLNGYLNGFTEKTYFEALRQSIVGDNDPSEVFLLELFPEKQKTLPDFVLTEKKLGVRTICATRVKQIGKKLFTPDNKSIKRIYNRVIFDDLIKNNVTLPFEITEDTEITWAGHPSWYFLLSKLSLPYLKHPCVPETYLLSELPKLPEDLSEWVLKPLFSYAGQGVVVGPTREQVLAAPDPSGWLLQRKIRFIPTIETPEGPTKVEIRIMCLNTPEGLKGMTSLLRMGRGALMGVDQNRDARWIGASAAFS